MKISITPHEREMLTLIARKRHSMNAAAKVTEAKVSNLDGEEITIDGIMGEYAVCKRYNVLFDISTLPRSGSYDCVINGKRIDVKSTRYPNGRLIKTLKPNPDVDLYILAINYTDEVDLIGWMWAKDFVVPEHITDLGYVDIYCVERKKLNPFV